MRTTAIAGVCTPYVIATILSRVRCLTSRVKSSPLRIVSGQWAHLEPASHGEPIIWRCNRRLHAPGLPFYLPNGVGLGGTCFEYVQHPCDERVRAAPVGP
jgi:hypothetical protein